MTMYGTMHMYTHERVEITCSHQLNERRPEGYPVLAIGTLTIYPTVERLERLRAVIDAYLAAHADEADYPEAGRPSAVRCDHCNNPTVAFQGHLRCFGCGNSMPLPATLPADIADAPGESLESMALEEIRSDLTEAAHEVGIDPDGLSDGEVIRALVGRVAAVRPASVG